MWWGHLTQPKISTLCPYQEGIYITGIVIAQWIQRLRLAFLTGLETLVVLVVTPDD